jgi:predicted regulator of amino acid metabolism with ACT domain
MDKKTRIKRKKDTKKAATIIETAELVGVSTRTVQRVIKAEQDNEKVFSVFMELTERKNRLLAEVQQLVPFL